ncbi:hypothetical protein MFUL124B02_31610 [Myxococcus fulvus 124B02]|nr:hypothetical protein MFUL124B02_31610 [Myxococcus fulvus 124B02]
MKLLGRDIPARELLARIEERLRTRGLPTSEPVEVPAEGVEPRLEPLTFNLHALEENADATRALPLQTHRGGVGQLVVVAKWAFRKSCQVFINETLGRQRVFNGHVRDSYAQLSAEVLRLRREVEQLRARQASALVEESRGSVTSSTPGTETRTSLTRSASRPEGQGSRAPTNVSAPAPRPPRATGAAHAHAGPLSDKVAQKKGASASRSHEAEQGHEATTASQDGHGARSTPRDAAEVLPKPRTAKTETVTSAKREQAPPTGKSAPSKDGAKSRRPKRRR